MKLRKIRRVVATSKGSNAMLNEGKLEEVIYTNIGEASMCWSERPKGVFDCQRASDLAKEILEAAKNYARNS